MKLALGISLVAAFALVLLYSILVGVMVPGWKSSTGNLLDVLSNKAVVYIGGENPSLANATANGWLLTTVKNVQFSNNGTVVIAIPSNDFYGNIEHGVVVASCAGLGVLIFLVVTLWALVHCCVHRQLEAKKRNEVSIPYTIFEEVK